MTKAKTRGKDLLTPMEVKHAEDGTYSDGGNLHLRVSNNGASRKWVFRYVRGGKAVEIGLGGANQVSLEMARKLRQQHLDALAEGLDPRAEKVKAAANRKTFAEAAAELIEARKKNWRTAVNDGRTSSLNEWTKHLTVDCKRIANRLVGDIMTGDITPIVKPIWDRDREHTARRLLSRIEAVFDYAMATNGGQPTTRRHGRNSSTSFRPAGQPSRSLTIPRSTGATHPPSWPACEPRPLSPRRRSKC